MVGGTAEEGEGEGEGEEGEEEEEADSERVARSLMLERVAFVGVTPTM